MPLMNECHYVEVEEIEFVPRVKYRPGPEAVNPTVYSTLTRQEVNQLFDVIEKALSPYTDARLSVAAALRRWREEDEKRTQ